MRYLIIVLMAVLLLAACESSKAKDCNTLNETAFGGSNDCWGDKAKATSDVDLCKNVGKKYRNAKPICVSKVAAKLKTPGLCDTWFPGDDAVIKDQREYCHRLYETKISYKD